MTAPDTFGYGDQRGAYEAETLRIRRHYLLQVTSGLAGLTEADLVEEINAAAAVADTRRVLYLQALLLAFQRRCQ